MYVNKIIKPYYEEEIKRISDKLNNYKDCFKFAVVADSHLDNSLEDTLNNIKAVDSLSQFDCLLHLGDFMNGNLSRQYTKEILKRQMELFKNCLISEKFYPVQGNHDGFADSITGINDMAIDEDWYEATEFADKYDNVSREHNKPYFYVDCLTEKIRIITVSSFYYTGFTDGGTFVKQYGVSNEQVEWLKKSALNVGKDWTVIIQSHDTPFENFNENVCIDNSKINGNEIMEIIKRTRDKNGFDLAAWFIGHYHGDYIGKVNGINFILVGSETAYIPSLWDMPENGYYPKRKCGTVLEDLWDAAVLDKENRKVRLFRFGAGEDREIDY